MLVLILMTHALKDSMHFELWGISTIFLTKPFVMVTFTSYSCPIVGVDESVDEAPFLDHSEDVKMMVKPLGHVKRVLRLISSVKTKVISSIWFAILIAVCLQEIVSSSSDTLPAEKMATASGSSPAPSTSSPALSARSCDYEGSSDSSSQPISPIFKMVYLLITASQGALVHIAEEEYATHGSKCFCA